MTEESYSQENAFRLLKQLEHILERDPLIDEVGFIHPSQFAALNGDRGVHSSFNRAQPPADEILSTNLLDVNSLEYDGDVFWSRDHKLAISTQMLFPLYNAARHAFMTTLKQRKVLLDPLRKIVDELAIDSISISEAFLESEVMKHSKVLLLLSCDFGTAWNSRKLVVLKKRKLSLFMEELLLSAVILSYSPKSEHAWSHRRWVIKTINIKNKDLQEIVGRESELVEKIAEKSKMNYRAWNHRCWLVAYMTREQALDELSKLRKWAELHVADNCCFHYRRRLMHKVLESSSSKQGLNAYHVWKEELDWNEMLIRCYVGREALWVHRRFLSQLATKHFAIDVEGAPCHSGDQGHVKHEISIFIDNELLLLRSCLAVPDNDFEDNRAQVVHAASYILWLSKQIPEPTVIEIQEKLRDLNLKTVLRTLCQEKALLWESLMG